MCRANPNGYMVYGKGPGQSVSRYAVCGQSVLLCIVCH